jgi:hypothetical protein
MHAHSLTTTDCARYGRDIIRIVMHPAPRYGFENTPLDLWEDQDTRLQREVAIKIVWTAAA